MASLEGVLARIPGLGGFVASQQMGQQQDMNNVRQLGVLQEIMQRQQAQQEQQQLKGMLSQAAQQSGGDPAKMHQLLLQSGNPAAMKMAQGLEGHLDRKAKLESDNLNRDLMRQQRLDELTQRGEQEIARVREQAAQNRITREEADRREASMRDQMARLTASLRPEPQPKNPQWEEIEDPLRPGYVIKVNPALYSADKYRSGDKTGVLGGSKPTASSQKADATRKQQMMDMSRAISELEKATVDGGLIDKSTGSGFGAGVDLAAGFIGKATPGSIAVGQMKPIFDLVLKMVPRFEGPQSDKDTKSYEQAAGQLANPNIPNSIKKEAGKEILRLMKSRRGQFTSKDAIGAGVDTGGDGGWKDI